LRGGVPCWPSFSCFIVPVFSCKTGSAGDIMGGRNGGGKGKRGGGRRAGGAGRGIPLGTRMPFCSRFFLLVCRVGGETARPRGLLSDLFSPFVGGGRGTEKSPFYRCFCTLKFPGGVSSGSLTLEEHVPQRPGRAAEKLGGGGQEGGGGGKRGGAGLQPAKKKTKKTFGEPKLPACASPQLRGTLQGGFFDGGGGGARRGNFRSRSSKRGLPFWPGKSWKGGTGGPLRSNFGLAFPLGTPQGGRGRFSGGGGARLLAGKRQGWGSGPGGPEGGIGGGGGARFRHFPHGRGGKKKRLGPGRAVRAGADRDGRKKRPGPEGGGAWPTAGGAVTGLVDQRGKPERGSGGRGPRGGGGRGGKGGKGTRGGGGGGGGGGARQGAGAKRAYPGGANRQGKRGGGGKTGGKGRDLGGPGGGRGEPDKDEGRGGLRATVFFFGAGGPRGGGREKRGTLGAAPPTGPGPRPFQIRGGRGEGGGGGPGGRRGRGRGAASQGPAPRGRGDPEAGWLKNPRIGQNSTGRGRGQQENGTGETGGLIRGLKKIGGPGGTQFREKNAGPVGGEGRINSGGRRCGAQGGLRSVFGCGKGMGGGGPVGGGGKKGGGGGGGKPPGRAEPPLKFTAGRGQGGPGRAGGPPRFLFRALLSIILCGVR